MYIGDEPEALKGGLECHRLCAINFGTAFPTTYGARINAEGAGNVGLCDATAPEVGEGVGEVGRGHRW